jgi:hypothetical protein
LEWLQSLLEGAVANRKEFQTSQHPAGQITIWAPSEHDDSVVLLLGPLVFV